MVVVVAIIETGCTSYGAPEKIKEDTLQLPVVTLAGKDTVLQTAYVADIQAVKNIEVRSRVKGFLQDIYVDEGKPVRKGQLLFKINDEEFKVSLSRAKAALANAIAIAPPIRCAPPVTNAAPSTLPTIFPPTSKEYRLAANHPRTKARRTAFLKDIQPRRHSLHERLTA